MSDDGFKRDEGARHEGPPQASPYPISRLAPVHDLVDLARQIQEADRMIGIVTSDKLHVVARQIRALQEEARSLMEAARKDAELHRAACSFKRRPGHTYHLYRRPGGELYFSMLSPEDWNGSPPHAYEGSYRLEQNMSWTRAEDIPTVDAERVRLPPLLSGPKNSG
jgi:hypothetical protein